MLETARKRRPQSRRGLRPGSPRASAGSNNNHINTRATRARGNQRCGVRERAHNEKHGGAEGNRDSDGGYDDGIEQHHERSDLAPNLCRQQQSSGSPQVPRIPRPNCDAVDQIFLCIAQTRERHRAGGAGNELATK
jgi:hypothetical protein